MTEDLPTINSPLISLPSTILHLLGVAIPSGLSQPIQMKTPAIERIILIMIDNFGLFEIVVHKPQFVISQSKALILLETQKPQANDVLHQIFFGNLENQNFNLMDYLNQNSKTTLMIGRQDDLITYAGNSKVIATKMDTNTWVSASKWLNRVDFQYVHFLDFENLYQNPIYKKGPPENLIQRLIHRTDKWMLSMYKQAAPNTLIMIVGNHGRKEIEMSYDPNSKLAQWRKASTPVAVLCMK
ncbi:MAG: hypothetical protein ACTSO9_02430 [Candidatus Helarchaeota archaeon]